MQRLPPPRAQRQRAAVKTDLVGGRDVIGELRLDLLQRDRRRQQDATVRSRAGQLADGNIGRARQRRRLLHRGTPTVSEHKTAAAAILGDTIGESEGEHHAGAQLRPIRRRGRRHLRRPAAGKVARARSALRAVAAELVEPVADIDAVAAKPALGEDGRDLGRRLALAQRRRIHDHARQPRRQRQRAQTFALGGDAAVGIERVELGEQALRLLPGRRGRRIEE